jgi:DNA-binding GntR family transcriptional regulator
MRAKDSPQCTRSILSALCGTELTDPIEVEGQRRFPMLISGSVEFSSKRALVEGRIRRSINEGELKPGDKLNADQVARQLKVSRTPVREAFHRLELEGFLRVEPCVGTVVVGPELQEVIDIYAIRINLEGLATRLATPHISTEDAATLEESVREIGDLRPGEDDYARINAPNRAFHFGIYERSGNLPLVRIIESLWDRALRFWAHIRYVTGSAQSTQEHQAILGAIRAKDAQRAERLMQGHLERSYQLLQRYLQASKGEVVTSAAVNPE